MGFPRSQAHARGLKHGDFESIRVGNLLALRTAEAAEAQLSGGRAFIIEQPKPWPGWPHMFGLPAFESLVERGARTADLDQCTRGAASAKPTRLLVAGVDVQPIFAKPHRCNHPLGWQDDGKGGWRWAAHPSLLHRRKKAGGGSEFATRAAQVYPAKFCDLLADICATAGGSVRAQPSGELQGQDEEGIELMDLDGARSSSATIPGAMATCTSLAVIPEPRPRFRGALGNTHESPVADS